MSYTKPYLENLQGFEIFSILALPTMLEELNKFTTRMTVTDLPVVVGIDEAGRGPAVGPMVYAAYAIPIGTKTSYKDSKLLSKPARELFFKNMANYTAIEIDPVYITSHMEAGTKTLNDIAREAVIILLNEISSKCKNIETIYVDALGDCEKYRKFLNSKFNYKFIVECKADSKYQVVSGASIVAKVIRDRVVDGYDCGSGYPSDPKTVEWLRRSPKGIVGMGRRVRHSWKTVKRMFKVRNSRGLTGEFQGFYTGSK